MLEQGGKVRMWHHRNVKRGWRQQTMMLKALL